MSETIKIKYHSDKIEKLDYIEGKTYSVMLLLFSS